MKSAQALDFAFSYLVPVASWTVKMLAVFYALIWSVTIDGVIMPLCSGKFVFCRVLSKLINPSGVNLDLDSFLTNWRESR